MTIDLSTPENRQACFSLLYMGGNLGFSIGPLLAGFLYASHMPWLFAGDALTTLIALLLVLVFVPETLPPAETMRQSFLYADEERGEDGSTLTALLKRPFLLSFVLITVTANLVYFQHAFSLPLQMNGLFARAGTSLLRIHHDDERRCGHSPYRTGHSPHETHTSGYQSGDRISSVCSRFRYDFLDPFVSAFRILDLRLDDRRSRLCHQFERIYRESYAGYAPGPLQCPSSGYNEFRPRFESPDRRRLHRPVFRRSYLAGASRSLSDHGRRLPAARQHRGPVQEEPSGWNYWLRT